MEQVKVGVGVLVIKNGKVLLGKRKGAHGAGEYGSIGGHLEIGETFKKCALRELKEEAGNDLKVKNLKFLCVTNLRKYAPKHYIDIGMLAEWKSGEAIVTEPERVERFEWFDIDNLPSPLFVLSNYIEAYKTGKNFFDS